MIHKIKVDADTYKKVNNRKRMAEIRSTADRHYGIGDTLHYCEVNEFGEFTGRELKKAVICVIDDMEGLKEGYVLLVLILKKGKAYLNRIPKDMD